MLIEMVAVTLTVFSGMTPLTAYFAPTITSPIPEQALQSSLPEAEIFAMLAPQVSSPESHTEILLSHDSIVQQTEPTATITPSPTKTKEVPTEKSEENTPTPIRTQAVATITAEPTETPTPTPTAPPPPVTAPGDLDSLFARFSDEYHVDRELLKRIAKCESGFNTEAVNGDYLGMFQFASSSWSAVRARMGADPHPDLRKNAEETIKTAAYHIANGGQNAWPSCK